MDFNIIANNLRSKGFQVHTFSTKKDATIYLSETLEGETIGVGGSITVKELGLCDALSEKNTVLSLWEDPTNKDKASEFTTYLTSANAIAQSGEIVNIDGTGNRVSATLYGPKKAYFIIGSNKVCPDLPSAIDRARNIAAPLNAKRLDRKTPCVVDLKCHDCTSPERICRAMVITMFPLTSFKETVVILIDETLGF